MKIRLTTEGKSVTIDLDQELAEKAFHDLALQLIKYCELNHPQKTMPKIKRPEDVNERYSYKGFVYLRCPKCGAVKGTCYKEERTSGMCHSCGNNIPFTNPFVPLYVKCQCGKSYKYMTNMTEEMFDINCVECGNPVAVQYNDRKNIYETIC